MTELARLAAPRPCRSDIPTLFKTQAERRAELRRMRTIATMLLVLMAVIYLAMRRAPPDWVWAPYLGAFAEAGMVGRLRRLVRRRSAFSPSPRPANSPYRGRAGKQAAHRRGDGTLHHQQLSLPARRHRAARVGRLCRSRGAMARGRAQRAGGRGRRRTHHSVRARPRAESGDRRMGGFCRAARDRGGPRGAARLARASRSCGRRERARRCSTRASISSRRRSSATRRRSSRHVSQKTWRWIPKWVDDMIAAKVINGLTGTLREMRDPDHPWREQANALIEKLIDDLAHDPEMRAQGEALKQDILANPVFAEQARALWEELETALRDDLPRHARSDRPLACGLRRRARPVARRGRPCAGRGSTGGSGCWRCARSCPAGRKSAPISPRWSTIGTPPRLSIASSCKSARTCNISASTARWSAGWSGS